MNLRDLSKQQLIGSGFPAKYEEINAGSLQRIADATEAMARGYLELIAERNYWKTRCERAEASLRSSARTASALRGVITKLKSRIGDTP